MKGQAGSDSEILAQVEPYTHWLLRIVWGAVFLHMGISKFLGGGISGFGEMMGLPFAVALLVALGEIAAGVLVLVGPWLNGWVTRLGALAGIPILVGAILMVHWGQWHFAASESHPMGGMAFQVTLLLLGLYLLIRGNRL